MINPVRYESSLYSFTPLSRTLTLAAPRSSDVRENLWITLLCFCPCNGGGIHSYGWTLSILLVLLLNPEISMTIIVIMTLLGAGLGEAPVFVPLHVLLLRFCCCPLFSGPLKDNRLRLHVSSLICMPWCQIKTKRPVSRSHDAYGHGIIKHDTTYTTHTQTH